MVTPSDRPLDGRYYLADSDVADAMREIGALSANGSAVFFHALGAF